MGKILDAAREAVEWTRGHGTMRVTLPGQTARDMTFAEYSREEGLRFLREVGVTLSRSGNEVRFSFPEGVNIDPFYDAIEAALAPPEDQP